MGISELDALINCAKQWLDKAVEAYDEEDYEAVDAAYRVAAGHMELAQLEVEREHLEMAQEHLELTRVRHRFEVTKTRDVLDSVRKLKPTPKDPLKSDDWKF